MNIKSKSFDYFHAYAITLDSKKLRIKYEVDEAVNIDEVICIYCETIGNFNSFLIS